MAEDLIAEAVIAIVSAVLSRTADEVKLAWNFKEELKVLEKKLTRIHMLLCGATDKRNDNPLVDDWLSKVDSVAYDADDLLDEFAYEAIKRKLKFNNQSKFMKNLRFFFTFRSNPIVFSFQMGHKVKKLIDSITDIFDDAQELGIKPVDLTAGITTSVPVSLEDMRLEVQRELVTGRGLIGRDQDAANILRMLCDPRNVSRDLTVVGIVGMAGLGKTALSKRAFDENEVRRNFDKQIWVCVSHDFDLKELLMKMVEHVGGETSNQLSLQAMLAQLKKNLEGRKYLLVLDDVWDTILSVWDSFSSALLEVGGSKGTTVLATSRSPQVVATMEIYNNDEAPATMNRPLIYQLKGLNHDDSLSLFQRRVDHIIDIDLSKKMVAKCMGVPLAINVLGDLLRYRSLKEWKEIEENEIWKFEDKNGILPSLRLSYNYLPFAAVKNCFAYCATFPEDTIIKREFLIQLWMAQGFLHPYDRMEQIGNEYFNILLNNSFFQDVLFDEHGKVTSCKMHDVVRALAMRVARQQCWVLSQSVDNISSDARHISVLHENALNLKLTKLRTIISKKLCIEMPNDLIMHAKCLRVLSLVDAGLSELPDTIGSFKHLRYLDVSENNIMKVPSAVGELYNLQTLRHICSSAFLCETAIAYPTLPRELGKLFKLIYICTNNKLSFMGYSFGMRLEPETSNLKSSNEKWGQRVSDISSLDSIKGSLAIWQLEHVSSRKEARSASLRSKANIHQLDLTWSYNATCITNCDVVLEELEPHENLEFFTVWYYNGKTLPSWLMEIRQPSRVSKLCNLVEMKFYYCRNLRELPTSLAFPLLKVLVVWGCHNLASFPSLDNMHSLEILRIGRCLVLEVLPNLAPLNELRTLEIHNCTRMASLPPGLANLHNLTELEIGPLCPELDFFPFPDINTSCPITKSLQKLCLIGWPAVKKLPHQLGYFTRLQTISIGHFTSFVTLPTWLEDFTYLQTVDIQCMENLVYLPSKKAMLRAISFRGFRVTPVQCPKLIISTDDLII